MKQVFFFIMILLSFSSKSMAATHTCGSTTGYIVEHVNTYGTGTSPRKWEAIDRCKKNLNTSMWLFYYDTHSCEICDDGTECRKTLRPGWLYPFPKENVSYECEENDIDTWDCTCWFSKKGGTSYFFGCKSCDNGENCSDK